MKHFELNVLDFQQYQPVGIEDPEVVGGSRPRIVLAKQPNNIKHFLKSYTHNPREIVAEFIASKLGALAGFKVQKVTIKTLPPVLVSFLKKKFPKHFPNTIRPIGALVKNIFPKGYSIRYGFKVVERKPTDKLKLSEIEEWIRSKYYAPSDLLENLAEMIIFDSWIGNMDRHHENWGIVESNKVDFTKISKNPKIDASKRRFTDFYDHGSSLLFELGEEKVEFYLKNKQQFIDQYILSKKYSHILNEKGESTNIFCLIESYIKIPYWKKYFKKAIERIEKIDKLKIAKLILQIPNHSDMDYSEERRELLFLSLCSRMDRLSRIKQDA